LYFRNGRKDRIVQGNIHHCEVDWERKGIPLFMHRRFPWRSEESTGRPRVPLSVNIGRHSAALSRQRPLERERAFITVASRTSREPGTQDFREGSVLMVPGRHVTGIVALQTMPAHPFPEKGNQPPCLWIRWWCELRLKPAKASGDRSHAGESWGGSNRPFFSSSVLTTSFSGPTI
jgi:hypothetical protein